jgi:predicted DNA-binding transcriptional regulator YafY
MGKSDLKTKNDRARRLLGLLRTEEHWTTHHLASELNISHRTLMRDLEELKEAGYPIEADRGRGGGIRLSGRWGIERLNLNNQEAITLILSLSITEALTSNDNDLGTKPLKQKIASAFPETQRKKINDLRKRILIGQLASNDVLKSYKSTPKHIWDQAMAGFLESKRIQLNYTDEKNNLTQRQVDPNYLLLNWPVWYILGWDYLRNDVRVFRLDRIKKIQVEDKIIVRRSNTLFLNAYEQYFKSI